MWRQRTMHILVLAAWLEVGTPVTTIATPPPPPIVRTSYARSIADLEAERSQLASSLRGDRAATIARARATLLAAITGEIIPAWYGTRWSFHGTSQTPGAGEIACGYFVATVLRDAGFRVDRVPLAQQGSGDIVRALVPASEIVELRGSSVRQVIRRPAGLYVIGLDKHVGFLVIDARGAQLCHSSNRAPRNVRCEPALTSRSLVSQTHIVGPLLTDDTIDSWLRGNSL